MSNNFECLFKEKLGAMRTFSPNEEFLFFGLLWPAPACSDLLGILADLQIKIQKIVINIRWVAGTHALNGHSHFCPWVA